MNTPVEIIPSSNLRQFFNALQRHGEVFTLEEMYARYNKQCFKIGVGILKHEFEFVEEGKRKLLKIVLKEVHSNGREAKLFPLFLFGSFAVAFKDLKLRKNVCVAFRSAVVENYTGYYTYKDHHDLQAALGNRHKKGAKIFLLRRPRNKNLNNCPAIPATRRRVAQDKERPGSSAQIAPVKEVYKYKRISELTVPEKNVNMYGVVSQILRGADDPEKHAVLRIIDETCKEDQAFQAHVFFKRDHVKPRLAVGHIVRFCEMKIEELREEMGGQIFSLRNLVTFPPKGTGKEGAFSAAESFHFDEYDKRRLAELRKWIESTTKPIASMISNVSEEGKYALECQVMKVDKIGDDMLILTATDCDQSNKKEVRIIVMNPSDELETVPLNTNVILQYVKVSATHVPTEERTVFVYEMQGRSSTFKLLKSFGDEARALVSQSSVMEHRAEENTANKLLKEILLLTSQSVEVKDSLMSTRMKEAAALIDVDVGRSQSSANFGRSDFSLMRVLGEIGGSSQLHSNMSRATPVLSNVPKENTEWQVLPSSYLSGHLLRNSRNASASEKCEIAAKENIPQRHKTNRHEVIKRMKNLLGPTIEEYKDSFSHTNESKRRRNDHQASGSNSRLPTMQRPIRDSAEGNVAAQGLSLRKSIRRQEKVVTIENEGEAECNHPCTSQPASDVVNISHVKYLEEALLTSEFEFATKGFSVDTYSQFAKNPQFLSSTQSSRSISSVPAPQSEASSGCESEIVPSSEVDGGSPVRFTVLNSYESEAYNVPFERWSLASASGQESLISSQMSKSLRITAQNSSETSASTNERGRRSAYNRELQNIGGGISEIKNIPEKMQTTNRNGEEKMDVVDDETENAASSGDGRCFTSDISDLPDLIDATISHVKQQDVYVETAYVLKAWLTKIQPPIDLTQKFPRSDNIMGSCPSCSKHYSFRAMNYKMKTFCKNCHEEGNKVLLNLSYIFRFHLVDENEDSIVVTLSGPNAVEFLGCTVNLYLGDKFTFNQTNKALSQLILRDTHLPPAERGPMLKLIVSPIITSKGPDYIMHNTYLKTETRLRS